MDKGSSTGVNCFLQNFLSPIDIGTAELRKFFFNWLYFKLKRFGEAGVENSYTRVALGLASVEMIVLAYICRQLGYITPGAIIRQLALQHHNLNI